MKELMNGYRNASLMSIVVVIDNPTSWFMPYADSLVQQLQKLANTTLLPSANSIPCGTDISFLLSCEKIVPRSTLEKSKHNIVVHASRLPQGKGMSPLTWQLLEGKDVIPVTLFEAVEDLDAGPVYFVDEIHLKGNELIEESRALLGKKIVDMCMHFVEDYPAVVLRGRPQTGEVSYYRKRRPEDSRLDPFKTLAEQFQLLRTVDNQRYPAFFDFKGRRYEVRINTLEDQSIE